MIKWLQGCFVETKTRVASVAMVLIVFIFSLCSYCYVITMKYKNLQVELQKLTVQVQNPTVIVKPVIKTKYIERIITKEAEPQTLILEREVSIENNGGSEVIPITGGVTPPAKNWTAGITYDTDGNVGGVVTRRVLGTIEMGVMGSAKTAGVLATIKF